MATQTETQTAARGTLSKVALPAAVAAAGAGVGLLLTRTPQRLRQAIPELPQGARDLIGDLKERVESVAEGSKPQASADNGGSDTDDFEERRRERKERRERRRQRATT